MKHYVYELVITETGKVIYVGKGSGQRMYYHAKAMKSKRVSTWPLYRRIKETVVDVGLTFHPRKIYETDDELAAYAFERDRINQLGLNTLLNAMPGGVPTKAEIGAAISKALKAYAQRCRDQYGKGCTPETANKHSESSMGKVMSAEFCDKTRLRHASGAMNHVHKTMTEAGRKAQREHGFSEHHRKAIGDALRGKPHPVVRKVLFNSRRAGYKSKFKGVSKKDGLRWFARIWDGTSLKTLGYCDTELQAAVLFDNAAEQLRGIRPNGTTPDPVSV